METVNLNLARKWRSKNFDQIVGQDLSIKMLKNSLYLGHFFPVYLFSGQRGCGKTSTARVFATAINCQGLAQFQQQPKQATIPCLICDSCIAMAQGKHPDFFELDAASHTGVDTIRHIIDAAQLLPLMGSKKIYLIDEAHMLSKAAFNALLKILEEPPRSVLFILATTDDQKIIDTVKSRCFQLFFKPIETQSLLHHLSAICAQENIACDTQGLRLIIEHAQGSARDAINILEQVRFSQPTVDKQGVLQALGHIDDETLLHILDITLNKNVHTLLSYLKQASIDHCAPEYMWQRFIQLVRAGIWIKHGVQPSAIQGHIYDALKKIVMRCSWQQLNALADMLYNNELVFQKTNAKSALFEMVLLHIVKKNKSNDFDNGGINNPLQSHSATVSDELVVDDEDECDDEDDDTDDDSEEPLAHRWEAFLLKIDSLQDPLLRSVFRQGAVQTWHETGQLEVVFAKDHSFFNEWLTDAQNTWLPFLQQSFSDNTTLYPLFTGASTPKNTVPVAMPTVSESPRAPKAEKTVVPTTAYAMNRSYQKTSADKIKPFPTDPANWPTAHLIMRYFPGTIIEVTESTAP